LAGHDGWMLVECGHKQAGRMLFWRAMAKNDENGQSCENKKILARHIFVIGEFCKFFGRDSENVPIFYCPALLFYQITNFDSWREGSGGD